MKNRVFGCVLVLAAICSISCAPDVGSPDEVAVLETSYGRIVIEFLPESAPRHVAAFKGLFRESFYDQTKIHQLLKEEGKPIAIQGGDPNSVNGAPTTWGAGAPNQKTIRSEVSPTLTHLRGTVSASHKPKEPDTAASQFFICLIDEPRFDGQYTIFGKVIEGINVADTIGRAPVVRGTDRPIDPVVINRAYLAKRSEIRQEER